MSEVTHTDTATPNARRVAMVLSNDAASDPRVEKEARVLAAAGWEVTIVAWDRSQSHPAHERRDGFDVVRLGPPASHGAGLRNVRLYPRFWDAAAEAVRALDPHVVHCHDTDTAPVGVRVKRRWPQVRLVLDFHELYAESKMIPRSGMKGAVARVAVRLIERRGVRRADAIVFANPGQVGRVAGTSSSDPCVVLVENAPDLARFPRPSRASEAQSAIRVCFIGKKRDAVRLEVLMKAIDGLPQVTALLAGDGTAEEEVRRLAEGRDRITTRGRLMYDEIPPLYEDCDVVYAAYDTSFGNYRTHFPVKAMEGMAAGLPVIVSEGTWVAQYVREKGIGFVIDDLDPSSVARALRQVLDDPAEARRMGARGRAIVEDSLNWGAAAERLRVAYGRLA